MNCIVVDDEEMARVIIEQLLSEYSNLILVNKFSNAIEAIKYLNHNTVDMIFLDIHMPDFSGFDFIQTIKNPPKIVLTTSDGNFAVEAFDYDCIVDYLIKPITPERFDKAIKKVLLLNETVKLKPGKENTLSDLGNDLYVNINRKLIKINMSVIRFIEARGDYIYINTENKNYTVHSTLKKIEGKLPEDMFLKIHRSYIINTKKIVDIEENNILIDKTVIPVSRAKRPELMKRINLL